MERQDYNCYLGEIERIKTMPFPAFMRDEIVSFAKDCALPDIVALFLLSEAAKEGKSGISNDYDSKEINSIDNIEFRKDDYKMHQFINALINYEIDLYYDNESLTTSKKSTNSEKRRTKRFISKDVNYEKLKNMLIKLTDQFLLFQNVEMTKFFTDIVTRKNLTNERFDDKIYLNCNTNLFVFVLTEIEAYFDFKFKPIAFTHFPIICTDEGNHFTGKNFKSTRNDNEVFNRPANKEEIVQFFRDFRKKTNIYAKN